MARIPYADDKNPEVAELAAQIVKERGKMHNLYKMLLNSPPVARGWLSLLTAVRQQAKLSGKFRELAILRVAIVNGADYEYQSHVPFGLKEGLTQKQIDALKNWESSDAFDDAERAVLAYTDSMTKEIHVPDSTFEPLKRHFDPRELVELTATIAAYNLVSRFLEAVQIDHETTPEKV